MRPSNVWMDEHLGARFPVLDDGFIRIVDYMGDESSIVQAARVSYGAGTKTVSDDVGLIRYLMRHRHCYHPSMQVLTSEGWKRWDECNYTEEFLVPDPETRTLHREVLSVEVFDCEEELEVFSNHRMSYRVTKDHRMWFKPKHKDKFEILRASEMGTWGHFDPAAGYRLFPGDFLPSPVGKLVGFLLGDGSWSGQGLTFHLRKERKKQYLRSLLADLNVKATESQSATYEDATVFYISVEDVKQSGVLNFVEPGQRAKEKSLSRFPTSHDDLAGVLDGLINSDGHVREDRNGRIEFSSSSFGLASVFETLAVLLGYDAHRVDSQEINIVHAFPSGRTSLEARAQYFRTEFYQGKVYCSTTSTGLLMVRGGPKEFGFVCGNSTPFEMCELKLHVRVPMDCWRQWIRHRMASVNEYSTRYSEAIDARQVTSPDKWRVQSVANKQGSSNYLPVVKKEGIDGALLSEREEELHHLAQNVYNQRIIAGVAREQARKDLPLSTYTEAYWKIDLHNLLHFLSLRIDSHAQEEIRSYAHIIGGTIVRNWLPNVWQAFCNYRLDALTLSSRDIAVLGSPDPLSCAAAFGWLERDPETCLLKPNRERQEFDQKAEQLGRFIKW